MFWLTILYAKSIFAACATSKCSNRCIKKVHHIKEKVVQIKASILFVNRRLSSLSNLSLVRSTVPCGDTFIDLTDSETRLFSSPLFPDQFPIHLACVWLIMADEYHRILLNVSHFEMHQDYVTIGEGHDPSNTSSVITRRHGASLREIITSRGSRIWITFEAQPSRTVYTGFSMEMYQYTELGK